MDKISALNDYIEAQRHVPFAWGAHDCVSFVAGAVEVQTGHRPFLWVTGYSNAPGAVKVFRRQGVDPIEQMDLVLERDYLAGNVRGSIVARPVVGQVLGYAFGVSIGRQVAFVGASGLEFDELREGDLAWRV